jgi:protein TonB
LRVVSGPALLRQAALDAVKQWRYRPYMLNGQPVEVETAVEVNFTLD